MVSNQGSWTLRLTSKNTPNMLDWETLVRSSTGFSTAATQLGHEAALFVAMHATETVRPAIVGPRCLALGHTMFAHVKFESALVGLVCIAVGCMNGRASAVTAQVARKCAALTAKAYPPQVPHHGEGTRPRSAARAARP
jgi:hypothetical protein